MAREDLSVRPTPERDPLRPVLEVARRLGLSTKNVAEFIGTEGMRSLDCGELIARGDFDTPLIREREITRFMQEHREALKEGARPVILESIVENTPFLVAFAFVMALEDGDINRVWEASSDASRDAFDGPKALTEWWRSYLDIANASRPGVASGLYPLGEHAVAVMYLPDTPASGGIVQGPTFLTGNPLAVVEQANGWRIDQPTQDDQDWYELIVGRQRPESDGAASGPT